MDWRSDDSPVGLPAMVGIMLGVVRAVDVALCMNLRRDTLLCFESSRAIGAPSIPSVDDQPGAERVLLLIAGLRPVAHAGREGRLQSRPLCRREAHGIVGFPERLGLALDDIGRNVRPGDLAREG